MFADRARIIVKSGAGGNGHVSFRREKFVPDGGPDGGDGGNGGSVIFCVDEGLNTLTDFRHVRKYVAESGAEGDKKNRTGKSGEDLYIKVPLGTVIKEATTGKVVVDMSGETKEVVLLKGGRGGRGNARYATPTMQAPKYAQPGQPSQELELILELKVIADVGLVGFPNVGKSTLLSRVSNAKPKIANYHFTTLQPNLGVVDLDEGKGFVMADIPGLIEGASEGIGLGHEFLRHVERTKVLIHIVDAAGSEGRDPVEDVYAINRELEYYNPQLPSRPQVIAANKLDLLDETAASEAVSRLKAEFEPQGYQIMPISAATGKGVRELLYKVLDMLSMLDDKPVVFAQEYFPEQERAVDDGPFTVSYDSKEEAYLVDGPSIEKMLGYTNLESEKGFKFFQDFLKEKGILEELEKMGIQDGDTVKVLDLSFDYYKN